MAHLQNYLFKLEQRIENLDAQISQTWDRFTASDSADNMKIFKVFEKMSKHQVYLMEKVAKLELAIAKYEKRRGIKQSKQDQQEAIFEQAMQETLSSLERTHTEALQEMRANKVKIAAREHESSEEKSATTPTRPAPKLDIPSINLKRMAKKGQNSKNLENDLLKAYIGLSNAEIASLSSLKREMYVKKAEKQHNKCLSPAAF